MTQGMLPADLDLAVIGAGPVGLGLALHAARQLPDARITLYDARAADADVSRDPRVLALSLGSVQWLERLGAWNAAAAQPILAVHVSQAPPSGLSALLGAAGAAEPALCIRASEEGVPMLGAVLAYGQIVAPLQAAWEAACAREPARLGSRFGTPVAALKDADDAIEVDAGIAVRHDLAVVAEGGVFAGATHRALAAAGRPALTRDYRQAAWVGQVTLAGGTPGMAFERFTRNGPAALLPLKPAADAAAPARQRAALVWCVASDDDPVQALDDAQRIAVLNSVFPQRRRPHRRHHAAEAFCARPERRAHAGRRPQRAHRQCRADAASGRRPGPQPRPARCARAGACAGPCPPGRQPAGGAAARRVAPRSRPLGDDRRHRLPRPQLHLAAAGARRGARPRPFGAADARPVTLGAGAADDVRPALSRWPDIGSPFIRPAGGFSVRPAQTTTRKHPMASTNDDKPSGPAQGSSEGTAGGMASPTPATGKKRQGSGQKVSKERGAHTHHKKNPGKRARQGGG